MALIEAGDNQGSGVVLRANIVATNCHMIEGADDIAVYKAADHSTDQRINKSHSYAATIRKFNLSRDMCLLTVQGLNGALAQTRDASSLSVSENVYAIGAPEWLDYSVSAGIVSQLRRKDAADAPTIQTDVAISPGSSGGVLVDGNDDVVGLTRKLVNEDIEGIAFALRIEWGWNYCNKIQTKKNQRLRRPC